VEIMKKRVNAIMIEMEQEEALPNGFHWNPSAALRLKLGGCSNG